MFSTTFQLPDGEDQPGVLTHVANPASHKRECDSDDDADNFFQLKRRKAKSRSTESPATPGSPATPQTPLGLVDAAAQPRAARGRVSKLSAVKKEDALAARESKQVDKANKIKKKKEPVAVTTGAAARQKAAREITQVEKILVSAELCVKHLSSEEL